jgi:hypothetical protein
LNDPVNFIDANGLWAIQIGFSGSGFLGTGGAGITSGIGISGNGFSINEVRFINSSEYNGGLGFSAGRGGSVTISPSASCLGDLNGSSLQVGFDSPVFGARYSTSAGGSYTFSGPSLGFSAFFGGSMTTVGSPAQRQNP